MRTQSERIKTSSLVQSKAIFPETKQHTKHKLYLGSGEDLQKKKPSTRLRKEDGKYRLGKKRNSNKTAETTNL